MYNPFGMNSARQGFGQQGSNQPYDFKGLESRLGKIETGIAGLTEQFGKFQMPGQETVDPEYTGNAAPDPLTPAVPTGGIQSLPTPQNEGFNFDPEGGSLMSQLSTAYGGQTNEEWGGGRGQPGFTQGFADFFTGEGYYADPRGTYVDGGWNISDKPIDLGSRFGGTLDPYGNLRTQTLQPKPGSFMEESGQSWTPGNLTSMGHTQPSNAADIAWTLPNPNPSNPFVQYQGKPNDMQQPIQQGAGLASLQKGYMT